MRDNRQDVLTRWLRLEAADVSVRAEEALSALLRHLPEQVPSRAFEDGIMGRLPWRSRAAALELGRGWRAAVIVLLVVLGFGFTGYLLPWDQKAFWATTVGTRIAEVAPVVGEWILLLMRGGQELTGVTLARFYGVHVWALPAALVMILTVHIYLVFRIGISSAPGKDD